MRQSWTIFKKEFRAYWASPIAYVVLVVFLLIEGYLFIDRLFLNNLATMRHFLEGTGEFLSGTPFIFVLLPPLIAMRLFAEEKKSGTIELLITLPVKDEEVVFGKFLASAAFLSIAVAILFIYTFIVAAIGDLDWGPAIGGYLGLFLMGLMYLAIGMMTSVWTKNQIVALVVALLISIALYALGTQDFLKDKPSWTAFATSVSSYAHFKSLARGVIDVRDILYYVTAIAICLFVTAASLGARNWERGWKTGWVAALSIVLIAANLVAFNMVVARAKPMRLDLTKNGSFTLSPASKKFFEKLEDQLTLRAYVTENMPAPLDRFVTYLKDVLEEFENASAGRVRVEIVEPKGEKERKEAEGAGIRMGKAAVVRDDKQLSENVFMGLVMAYADKKETIPWLPDEAGNDPERPLQFLEYEIARRIKAMTLAETKGKKKKVLGIVAGGLAAQLGTEELSRNLGQFYEFRTIDIKAGKKIEPEIEALLILAPTDPLHEREKFEIDQFIMRGGRAAFFLTNIRPTNPRQQPGQPPINLWGQNDDGLRDVLKHYGVEIKPGLVLDQVALTIPVPAYATIGQRRMQVMIRKAFPLLPIVGNLGDLMRQFRATAQAPLLFPFTGEVAATADARDRVEVLNVAKSSPASWKYDSAFIMMGPQLDLEDPLPREVGQVLAEEETLKENEMARIEIAERVLRRTSREFTKDKKEFFDKLEGMLKDEIGAVGAVKAGDALAKKLLPKVREAFQRRGPFSLGVALKGKFKSYWENTAARPVPKAPDPAKPEDPRMPPRREKVEADPNPPPVVKESPLTQILVVANGLMVTDGVLQFTRSKQGEELSNFEFALNLVDWLMLEEDLMQIRNAGEAAAQLKVVESGTKTTIRVVVMVLFPLLVLVAALVLSMLRKMKSDREIALLSSGS
ncbi:MAG: Gldg family protein [Deltaproteobacteria bacterium]|nr:Gldg family protein [Deltaproteobacteria bacterium]